jgi:hypothetical protein
MAHRPSHRRGHIIRERPPRHALQLLGEDMSLADRLKLPAPAQPTRRAPVSHPQGWEPSFEWNGEAGQVNTGPLKDRPTDWDAYLRESGLDPEAVEVIEPVNVRGWQATVDGVPTWLTYYRLTVRRRQGASMPDLVALFKAAKAARIKAKELPEGVESATVALWADPQTGKVASRGGTPQLIERVEQYQEGLARYSRKHRNDAAYMFDLGDAIEGFENAPQQEGTNDLSLMDQVDVATTVEFELFKTLGATHNAAVLAGIGSNHCRWRRGKDALGTPGDDWGIHMLKQIHRRTADQPDKFGHMSVRWPDQYEESIALDVAGTIIGAAHGHQANRPEGIPDWWAKQTHGGQPIAHADILLTGHFHSLRVQTSGRNPVTNKAKWWIQAPTADNGSDWYRYRAGADSDPGMLVFTVTKNGWSNLELL